MKHDKLHLVIRNDKLLLTYGAVEVGKKERDRYYDVGYALRVLAKLLLQYRKQFNAEDASAKDLVNAISYDNIISSMKVCADYCGPRKIGNPRLVLRIGYSLKTLAIIVKLEYLKLGLGYGRKSSSVKALVPIIFTEEVVGAIRLLINSKHYANISPKNNYVFARGWDALQSLTKKLNLLKPKLITPTRKYLSTILQLLDMNNAELLWLTNHMGHTKDVHQNWYRRDDSTIELTKVTKVLLAMDNDDTRCIQNKKIDSLLQNSFEGIGISNVNT
nr:uncharacterized protein LOC124806911 [Hydra vulgaris]